MNYLYCRVSSNDGTQKTDRQIAEGKKWAEKNGIKFNDIFQDYVSGKNFDRPQYITMKGQLEPNDLVVILSIDRLGRDYDGIIKEWTEITKVIKADIAVIDMPLLDTRTKDNQLTGKLISDIVLQLLSYVAETERKNIRERQREGIAVAKAKGVKFGRTSKYSDDSWKLIKQDYENGMKMAELLKKYNLTCGNVYAKIKKEGWQRL